MACSCFSNCTCWLSWAYLSLQIVGGCGRVEVQKQSGRGQQKQRCQPSETSHVQSLACLIHLEILILLRHSVFCVRHSVGGRWKRAQRLVADYLAILQPGQGFSQGTEDDVPRRVTLLTCRAEAARKRLIYKQICV